jgi:RNA polymerase sigma-70 factor, ECF subfamily
MLNQSPPLAARFGTHMPRSCFGSTTAQPTEAELIAASRRGDTEAYGTLVRQYQNRLCSSLRHICGSLADAQDAAQEAFLRAYLNLNRFTGSSAFYTWLYRIAVNFAISEQRKRHARQSLHQNSQANHQEPAQDSETCDARLLRQERAAQVQEALASLSPEHRTILVLREIEDCDYDEIASILSIPVGTVRSRLHRARLQLRERLNCN